MRRAKLSGKNCRRGGLVPFAVMAVILGGMAPGRALAQEKGQKTFPSAEAACEALVKAAEANDQKAMLEVLGPSGKDVLSSGDPVQDKENRDNFAKRYEEMHRLIIEPDGMMTLYIGAQNWPSPIPLTMKNGVWYFDTAAGKKEILYRRVGRNEISAIRICQELVSAEKEYFSEQNAYAEKIFSDEGKKDGLYWKAAEGEPQSPIGPLVAAAVTEGYAPHTDANPTPYRGYIFHTLTEQGKSAAGGMKSYVVNGKMTGGFAFVAYPAAYRSSGVMTFIVGADGIVFQKDLGKNTAQIAKAMKKYDPDSTWQRAQDEEESAETKAP